MKKVEFIIRPAKFEEVKEALGQFGVHGMTVTHVTGCGLQRGKTEFYRGSQYTIDLLPKVKVEVVISDQQVAAVIELIRTSAYTGQIGDGKIFVYTVETAVRIRTGESGESAI